MVMSEKEKLNTAYHEAGHAIVGVNLPEHDPVYKVTIIPRGRALGVTWFLPEGDRYSTASALESSHRVAVRRPRRRGADLRPDGVTTGASNDIERATDLARNMVTKWGLSDKLGPLTYSEETAKCSWAARSRSTSRCPTRPRTSSTRKSASSSTRTTSARRHSRDQSRQAARMADALVKYETIDETADQGHHGGRRRSRRPTGTIRSARRRRSVPKVRPRAAHHRLPAGQH
jgi:cell division protease FtsH